MPEEVSDQLDWIVAAEILKIDETEAAVVFAACELWNPKSEGLSVCFRLS